MSTTDSFQLILMKCRYYYDCRKVPKLKKNSSTVQLHVMKACGFYQFLHLLVQLHRLLDVVTLKPLYDLMIVDIANNNHSINGIKSSNQLLELFIVHHLRSSMVEFIVWYWRTRSYHGVTLRACGLVVMRSGTNSCVNILLARYRVVSWSECRRWSRYCSFNRSSSISKYHHRHDYVIKRRIGWPLWPRRIDHVMFLKYVRR